MKLKAGDKIYFVNPAPEFHAETGIDPDMLLNRVFVINCVDDSDCPYYIREAKISLKESEVVSEEIYNSPLFKVMCEV